MPTGAAAHPFEEYAVSDHPLQPSGPSGEDPFEGLPPELLEVLRSLTGGQLDPQMASMLKDMGLDQVDPAMLQMVGAQVRSMFASADDGPVQQSAAADVARKTVAQSGDPSVGATARRHVSEAADAARLWLDATTNLPAHEVGAAAWSRAEWVEATMPVWCDLVEPVATGVASAISDAIRGQLNQLGELGGPGGLGEGGLPEGLLPPGTDPSAVVGPMMTRMSSMMFSLQLGMAVGRLAEDVLSGTEVALPLVPGRTVVLLPTNVEAFAEGLGLPADEVRLYLAVRESARVRLFGGVPWLGAAVTAAVRDYARDIRIDTDRIEAGLAGIDLTNPEALQSALQDSLFSPEPSEAQRSALTRLETLLALVEGWVDLVTDRATREVLPHAVALGEAVRRRRATGGPAEKTFASLVGLELRPRRLRDAANLWAALEDRLGTAGRDAAWSVPDLAPTTADLDDPLGYVERAASGAPRDEMDAALDALLAGDAGPGSPGSQGGSEPDDGDGPGDDDPPRVG
ncbi:conserved hypothetical protein [Nostocoides japonicum T1-X7]|uniref:Hydrolase n=1 Tax=Nostocoides japonicum T1-X7 TaxID=1194083 RepID=A0A077LWZ2_9MICO|nr:zinc-dependent metalloprotease [Tetrasphaera japonica]CCH77377.1 conserved hypothetical protein [Tetrasphaera japonica T1-X7]